MPAQLYRRDFNAAALVKEHPPQFRHASKQALFELAYPGGSSPTGLITVTRWAETVPDLVRIDAAMAVDVRPDFYDYAPVGAGFVEWHVNFADPRLFVAYGSGLFAQDEMQVAEHPVLGSVREALLAEKLRAETSDEDGATPILVRNVERRLEIATNLDARAGRPHGLYGNRFAAASLDVIRQATRRIDPPTVSNIIAMAAPAGGRGEYTRGQIDMIFATAFTGFSAARHESGAADGSPSPTVIHTGFWGCGAFGGNRTLMIALQVLAARAAGISRVVLHAADRNGMIDAQHGLDAAELFERRCGSPCSLDDITAYAEHLGYRWGVSDGN